MSEEPVPKSTKESKERLETEKKSNVQEGSVPKKTGERKEAPEQEKAAASPS